MADKWIPDDVLALTPKISNFTENPTTVQFDHRILGTTTLTLISILWMMSRKRTLPPRAYIATTTLASLAWLQVLFIFNTVIICIYKSTLFFKSVDTFFSVTLSTAYKSLFQTNF